MFSSRRPRGKSAARRSEAVGLKGLRTWLIGGLLAVGVTTYAFLPEEATLPKLTADPPQPAPRVPSTAPFAPPASGLQPAPRPPPAPGVQPAPVAPAAQSPLDPALRLLNEAAQYYQGVRDYTCTMIKQERVRGVLQPEHYIQMKFRTQPFSVYMRWLAPKQFANQEVCYVQGRNQNMMRVHSTGILGAIGWVSIPPTDPRAMEHSRHSILEAGFGGLIERMRNDWTRDRLSGKLQVNLAEYEYNKRPCIRIEVTRQEWNPQAYCGRVLLYLDKETRLPVRTECYDFPRPGSQPGGDLLECFSYIDVRVNVGLTDNDFRY